MTDYAIQGLLAPEERFANMSELYYETINVKYQYPLVINSKSKNKHIYLFIKTVYVNKKLYIIAAHQAIALLSVAYSWCFVTFCTLLIVLYLLVRIYRLVK